MHGLTGARYAVAPIAASKLPSINASGKNSGMQRQIKCSPTHFTHVYLHENINLLIPIHAYFVHDICSGLGVFLRYIYRLFN